MVERAIEVDFEHVVKSVVECVIFLRLKKTKTLYPPKKNERKEKYRNGKIRSEVKKNLGR